MRKDTFHPQYYLDTYPDLRDAYGPDNVAGAEQHWLQYGVAEGRTPNRVFAPQQYMARYPDLRAAFGATNWAAAAQHWVQYGIGEGRIGY